MYRGNVIPADAGIQNRGDRLDARVRMTTTRRAPSVNTLAYRTCS